MMGMGRRGGRRAGRRTARRVSRRQAARQAPPPQQAPPPAQAAPPAAQPAAPPGDDYAAELQKLASLKEQGILTEEEFQAKKKQVLGI